MKQNLIISILICLTLSAVGQTDSLIFLRKIDRARIATPLPYRVELIIKNSKVAKGTILSQSDSTILLRKTPIDYDKRMGVIRDHSLSQKEKGSKLDSIYKSDSNILTINKDHVTFIRFHVKNVRTKKYKIIYHSLLPVYAVSGAVLIIAVTGNMNKQTSNILMASAAVGIGTTLYFSKKRLSYKKWDIQ